MLAASDGMAASVVDATGGAGTAGVGVFGCAALRIGSLPFAPARAVATRVTEGGVAAAGGSGVRGEVGDPAASGVRAPLSSATAMRAAKLAVPSRGLRVETAAVASGDDDCVSAVNPTVAVVALPSAAGAGAADVGVAEPGRVAGVTEIGAGETMSGSQQSAPQHCKARATD